MPFICCLHRLMLEDLASFIVVVVKIFSFYKVRATWYNVISALFKLARDFSKWVIFFHNSPIILFIYLFINFFCKVKYELAVKWWQLPVLIATHSRLILAGQFSYQRQHSKNILYIYQALLWFSSSITIFCLTFWSLLALRFSRTPKFLWYQVL